MSLSCLLLLQQLSYCVDVVFVDDVVVARSTVSINVLYESVVSLLIEYFWIGSVNIIDNMLPLLNVVNDTCVGTCVAACAYDECYK